jgi:hypothetical protein
MIDLLNSYINQLTEVEVNLRPTVSRPVYPGVRCPSGTCDQFFFRHEISCRQLRLCYFVAPSLTRGQVCNLLLNCFWALPEQSLLSRSPAELTAIFYCLIWGSPNLEGQFPVFISPRNRAAQLYLRTMGSRSVASYDSRRLRWRYSNPPPHGIHLTAPIALFITFRHGSRRKHHSSVGAYGSLLSNGWCIPCLARSLHATIDKEWPIVSPRRMLETHPEGPCLFEADVKFHQTLMYDR